MFTEKRRRYTRYELKLTATLVINNTTHMQCIIRDFCSGGLFIEPKQRSGIETLKPQQKIQVLFSNSLILGGEEFSLDAKIMHFRGNGLGVAFEKNYKVAFEALKKEAQSTLGLIATNIQGSPSKQKNLEDGLASLLLEALPAIIRSFYQHSEEKLRADAEHAKNIDINISLQDVFTNLKINKNELSENFCAVAQEACYSLTSTSGQIDKTDKESSLSLVEKDDFEDWLNLLVIIRNLESLYESQLEQLQKKMAYIIGVDKEMVINPACPAKLCDYFRDTITVIEEHTLVKRTLYTIFEQTLLECLPDLYKKIDAFLIKNGAPKKVVGAANWKKINPETDHTKSHSSHSTQTQDASTPQAFMASDGDGDTLLTAQPIVSAQQTKPVINVASNLLHLLQGQNFPQHNIAGMEATAQEYSAKEISSALAHLQHHAAINNSQHPSRVLQDELVHTLESFSTSDKHLSSTDKNNLEVYESLFEILFNDMLLSKEVRSYLKDIQLPIIDQAMQDPSFLEPGNHPARNIVNHLSWLESAIKGDKTVKNTQIRQTLDDLMEQINHESPNNPTIFSSVEQQLNEITASVNKSIDHNINRVTGSYEGKQNLENARQSVQEELDQHFSGKKIPKIVASLLEAGWQHLLVIAKLNKDDAAFQNYLRIIINLTAWLTASEIASEEQAMANTTLEYIDQQLRPVCTNTFLHSNILRDLKALFQGNSLQTGSDAIEMIPFEAHENAQIGDKPKSHIDEIDQLREGEWLTFLLEKKPEPLKLIWIGKHQDVFVFVNRKGIKTLELNREELGEMFSSGTATRIENLDKPVMDRAVNVMLQNMHEKLLNKATHDPVTHLLNRKEFIKQLKQELLKFGNVQRLLCNIEVQDFRIITNACGLSGGDELLKQLADILQNQLGEEGIFARLDDKTFSILLEDSTAEDADNIAKNLQSKLVDNDFKWEDKSYAIAVSIGIMPLFPDISYDVNSVLQKTDSATLSAKNDGRNRIRIYKEDDESFKSQYNEHEWIGRLNQVFADNRLFLRCQKIAAINPEANSHTHYEILLGIKDENGNVIAPDDFIPAVERCRRMSEIDRWVVLEVFDWIEQHYFDFDMLDGFSINLSGESLNSEEFLDFLKQTLATRDIPLEKITFEITETVAADSYLFVQSFIQQIKHFNCKFSLDDFGSGYSSYSYLKSLDVDYLKIDGAFIKDILNNSTDVAIVKSMNEIAHSLGLETIAEYVENDEINAMLIEIGVDYSQGWGIEKPILLNDLA